MHQPYLLAFLSLAGCGTAPLCSSKIVQVARDPGSDRYATVTSRNCGATTDYATVVRVGRASEPQDEAEEVFVADSNHGAATEGNGGTIWIDVYWPKPGQLFVARASHARVFKQRASANQVSIDYRPTDPWVGLPPPS